jgi:hypothetical protein
MMFLRRQAQSAAAKAAAAPSRPPVTGPTAGRTAPEPLTILLPAIAALGAVASIAAVAFVAEDRDGDRPRVKRRVDAILKDLETACLGIGEILRRMRRHARQLGLDGPNGSAPMKLGLAGGRVELAAGQLYYQFVNDLATMLVLATQNSIDAVNAIEDGEIEPPDEVLFAFGDAQERLNGLITARAGLRPMVDGCIEVSDQFVGLVRQLKTHRSGGAERVAV